MVFSGVAGIGQVSRRRKVELQPRNMVSMTRDLRTGYLLRHQSADGRCVSPRRQGGLERRRGRPDQAVDRQADPGPAGAAVRLVDQPGRARADRAALRQAARPDGGAARPAALRSAPTDAAGPGQRAPARRCPAWVETACPAIARRAKKTWAAVYSGTRPASPTRTRPGAPLRPEAGPRWSREPPSGSRKA
jgi:hypothetical protein